MRVVIILTQESDQRLYKPALESLRSQIRASTTSMTSVPKPLKFLRPHYDSLKEVHEKIKDDETKVAFRNYLSSELFILILHCLNSSVDTDKGYYFVFVFIFCNRDSALTSYQCWEWLWVMAGTAWSSDCLDLKRKLAHGDMNMSGRLQIKVWTYLI